MRIFCGSAAGNTTALKTHWITVLLRAGSVTMEPSERHTAVGLWEAGYLGASGDIWFHPRSPSLPSLGAAHGRSWEGLLND